MILRSPLDLRFPDLFFALDGFVNAQLKLEGFHLTGSRSSPSRNRTLMAPALGIVV
jgi:hypothetical protein